MKNLLSFILLIFLCKIPAQNLPQGLTGGVEIIAEIGPVKITVDEFTKSYIYGPAFLKRESDSPKKHLRYMINEKLLALYARAEGLDKSEQVSEMHEAILSDVATGALYEDVIFSKVNPARSFVDSLVRQKQIELEIKWIYSSNEFEIKNTFNNLKQGAGFDSLFLQQINENVLMDTRSMKCSRYTLGTRNTKLASIIDTLGSGNFTTPLNIEGGWYIIKLSNVSENLITTEYEAGRLRNEAVAAAKKIQMDRLSDEYVSNLLGENNIRLNNYAFDVCAAYLANLMISPVVYKEWNVSAVLDKALENLGRPDKNTIGSKLLVDYNQGKITLNKFFKWYRAREQYIKLNKNDFNSFKASLQQFIPRIVRDEVLTARAMAEGYFDDSEVIKQSNWWLDKIIYSAAKNHLASEITLQENEISSGQADENLSENEAVQLKLKRAFLNVIKKMERENKIVVNYNLLNTLKLEANNKKEIDFYAVKKGGLIPRYPYPTIDEGWAGWQ